MSTEVASSSNKTNCKKSDDRCVPWISKDIKNQKDIFKALRLDTHTDLKTNAVTEARRSFPDKKPKSLKRTNKIQSKEHSHTSKRQSKLMKRLIRKSQSTRPMKFSQRSHGRSGGTRVQNCAQHIPKRKSRSKSVRSKVPHVTSMNAKSTIVLSDNDSDIEIIESCTKQSTSMALSGVTHSAISPQKNYQREFVDCRFNNYQVCDNDFRVSFMSYNILCQTTIPSTSYLYSPNTHDPRYLEWNSSRWPLIQREIHKYKPTVLCMQEVQMDDVYERDILPFLTSLGYITIKAKRPGNKNDGCTLSYLSDQLEMRYEPHIVNMNMGHANLDKDNVAIIAALHPRVSGHRQPVIVSCTHLLFAPNHGHIKLSQLALLLARTDSYAAAFIADARMPPIVYCGDFNMTPLSAMHHLVINGELEYESLLRRDVAGLYISTHGYRNGGDNYVPRKLLPSEITDLCVTHGEHGRRFSAIPKMVHSGILRHPQPLVDVYTHLTQSGEYEVSTYNKDHNMVDFIFYTAARRHSVIDLQRTLSLKMYVEEANLHLLERLELPSIENLRHAGQPLPNATNGSDHLPIMARFALNPN